ncbi:DEAD/DEAH box helicase [Flavihumibacter sp. CACIAM 22H1]|uniref:DEAD/DEAH box helicase n=1 Tax=Flavihumibacter sp. CACIAM 22H1 TaxID=1812911 RepID=UPI0007A8E378|nr:DEAD/DEAH box helicase [Flavihumibacter sp. CACIAM 22H1]KYP16013.1 MAG: DNA helicase [Flavihumibacter sp. CACIAM 22H1]
MDSIQDLSALLVPIEELPCLSQNSHHQRIVVLKQFRFHKSLCIELYDAPVTKAGKIRNPLIPVSATDASLQTGTEVDAVRFYAAISRFQLTPSNELSAADLRGLKLIIKNPLQLRFFYHNPEFSENVSAGSLEEVQVGNILEDFHLLLYKSAGSLRLIPEIILEKQPFHPKDIPFKYGIFLLHQNQLWLPSNRTIIKLLQFFRTRPQLQFHESQWALLQEKIVSKLEEKIRIIRHDIDPADTQELVDAGWHGAQEKLIYLSDLGQYITIQPMVRYGNTELPLRSKKMVYLPGSKGRLLAIHRNEASEKAFLSLLLKQHPHFLEQLEEELPYFYLHRDRFLDEDWFLNVFDQWRRAGITIFGFNQLKDNKKNAHKATISVQVVSGLNWFNVKLKAQFGEQTASLQELQKAIRNKRNYVQLDDGSLGLLPNEWIDRMSKFFFGAAVMGEDLVIPGTQFEAIDQLFSEEEIEPATLEKINNYRKRLTDIRAIEKATVPETLQTALRPYQQQGLSWLYFLHQQQFGAVLADDMGLGKTVQVIAFLLLLQEKSWKQPHLLVVPTSLLFNWQVELQRFAPSLSTLTLHGANRPKTTADFDNYHLVLISYGTLLTDISHLRRFEFGYIILDESQQIKNPDSQRYQAVQMLRSYNRLAITGTPFENNTMDLFAQFSFACPGLLGSKKYFQDIYSIPIDRYENRKRMEELQQKTAAFLLRRTKDEVLQELPDKIEQVLYCPMGEAQRAVYDRYEKELRDYLEDKMEDEILRNSMHVLRGLTQLRQICDDPGLLEADYLQGEGSSKLDTLVEQLQIKSPHHKILVFSQFVSMLDLLSERLNKMGILFETLTGATRNRQAVVDRFQQDPSVRVFLLSLKAGGVGLNLTAASYVYLVDPWWNPSVEDQAIDRAYRIGQHRNVQAIRLICPGTVEEKMQKLQKNKKERSAGLVQSGNAFFNAMTKEDWKTLLG